LLALGWVANRHILLAEEKVVLYVLAVVPYRLYQFFIMKDSLSFDIPVNFDISCLALLVFLSFLAIHLYVFILNTEPGRTSSLLLGHLRWPLPLFLRLLLGWNTLRLLLTVIRLRIPLIEVHLHELLGL